MQFQYKFLGWFRLLLALMVVVSHMEQPFAPEGLHHILGPLHLGMLAVLLFFVVSGYVISEACEQFYSNRPGAFLGNRFFRIYPPFIFALGVSLSVHFVCYLFGRHGEVFLSANDVLAHLNFREVARNVFSLLDNTIPNGKENYYLFVRYVWAIVVEVQFYLVMAVIFYLRKTLPVRLHISFRLVLTLLCLLYLFHITFKMSGIKGIDYTPYFLLGVITYRLSKNHPSHIGDWAEGFAIFILANHAFYIQVMSDKAFSYVGYIIFGLLFLIFFFLGSLLSG